MYIASNLHSSAFIGFALQASLHLQLCDLLFSFFKAVVAVSLPLILQILLPSLPCTYNLQLCYGSLLCLVGFL